MAVLVHIAPEQATASILEAGIRATKLADGRRAVFCMPVLPNYFLSHQWLRELRRGRGRNLVGIDFRLSSSEPVLLGHYGNPHVETTIGASIATITAHPDPRGWEVLVLRSIQRREILGVRALHKVVGWRYQPDAHGKPPCSCESCTRGAFGGADLRARGGRDAAAPTKPALWARLERALEVGIESEIEEALWAVASRRDRATQKRLLELAARSPGRLAALIAETLAATRGNE